MCECVHGVVMKYVFLLSAT